MMIATDFLLIINFLISHHQKCRPQVDPAHNIPITAQPLYNTVHCNMVLDITLIIAGPQADFAIYILLSLQPGFDS